MTRFSFGTWSSSSSSQGLELGLGESWHQTSKAFRLCTIGRRLVIQADDSVQVASICRASFTSRTKGKYPRKLHIGWQSKTYPSLLEIPLSFLSNSILQSTSQRL